MELEQELENQKVEVTDKDNFVVVKNNIEAAIGQAIRKKRPDFREKYYRAAWDYCLDPRISTVQKSMKLKSLELAFKYVNKGLVRSRLSPIKEIRNELLKHKINYLERSYGKSWADVENNWLVIYDSQQQLASQITNMLTKILRQNGFDDKVVKKAKKIFVSGNINPDDEHNIDGLESKPQTIEELEKQKNDLESDIISCSEKLSIKELKVVTEMLNSVVSTSKKILEAQNMAFGGADARRLIEKEEFIKNMAVKYGFDINDIENIYSNVIDAKKQSDGSWE